jgi:2-hydroxy-3-keto-5-methylthiopentenyl-1-phosphate phosphatase
MARVICIDFDDTLVLDNTMAQIMQRFAGAAWGDVAERYRRGEISVEQQNAEGLDLVEAEPDEIRQFVREVARPRPGILELNDWAQWNGWLVTIVSNGFDLYVDPVLDDLGLDRVTRHCGRTRKEYRWRVRYYSPRGVEVQSGFKLAYAASFENAGDFVVYIGDGSSDVDAARLAPVVFARDTLWERLKDQHPRIYAFETFHDVAGVLQREAESWLASFSSTTAAEG